MDLETWRMGDQVKTCNGCRYWRGLVSDDKRTPVRASEVPMHIPVYRQCGSLKSPHFKCRTASTATCSRFAEYDLRNGSLAEAIQRRHDPLKIWPVSP
jgi:hypothetical protein